MEIIFGIAFVVLFVWLFLIGFTSGRRAGCPEVRPPRRPADEDDELMELFTEWDVSRRGRGAERGGRDGHRFPFQ